MKYEFGVMSSRYSLESETLRTAKLVMSLFMRTPAPIAIYLPIEEVFRPTDVLNEELGKTPPEDLVKVRDSIKKLI